MTELQAILSPIQERLEAKNAAKYNGEEELTDTDILFDMFDALSEGFSMLGHLEGEVLGAGMAWVVDVYYYMPETVLDGQWHFLGLSYDDSEMRWMLVELGSMEAAGLSLEQAAHELLKRHAEPGTDQISQRDCEDLIEEWRCKSEGLPVPQSRADRRFDERFDATMDLLQPLVPNKRDGEFNSEELEAFFEAMSLVIKVSPNELQAMRAAKIEDVVESIKGSAESWVTFYENHAPFPSLTNVMRLSQRLAMMREAKRVFIGQQLVMLTWSEQTKGEEEGIVRAFLQAMKVGFGGDQNVDLFHDLGQYDDANKHWSRRLSFRPKWPFMPLATTLFQSRDGEVDSAMSERGMRILWMRDGQSHRSISLRLDFQNEKFMLMAETFRGEQVWPEALFDETPSMKEIAHYLSGRPQGDMLSFFDIHSPLAWLCGEALELKDRNVRFEVVHGITVRIEFDLDDASPPQSWLSRALAPKNEPSRRVLFSCSNYHVWPEMFVDLFGGTFVSAEYQRDWRKLN